MCYMYLCAGLDLFHVIHFTMLLFLNAFRIYVIVIQYRDIKCATCVLVLIMLVPDVQRTSVTIATSLSIVVGLALCRGPGLILRVIDATCKDTMPL